MNVLQDRRWSGRLLRAMRRRQAGTPFFVPRQRERRRMRSTKREATLHFQQLHFQVTLQNLRHASKCSYMFKLEYGRGIRIRTKQRGLAFRWG